MHEGERLLLTVHPSASLFVRDVLRCVLEAFLVAIALSVIAALFLGTGVTGMLLLLWIVIAVLLSLIRYRHWRHAMLRVTTDRILLQPSGGFLSHPLRTIKWNQYQESFLGHRSPVDMLFGVRTLVIRYGNADSKLYASFPGLRFGSDIKHYLDKIDSAVRQGEPAQVRPFVFKRRGRRDEA